MGLFFVLYQFFHSLHKESAVQYISCEDRVPADSIPAVHWVLEKPISCNIYDDLWQMLGVSAWIVSEILDPYSCWKQVIELSHDGFTDKNTMRNSKTLRDQWNMMTVTALDEIDHVTIVAPLWHLSTFASIWLI